MPGPPTPVLDCPLMYLEIRDGASAGGYHSSHPHGVFTLTIEGERRVDAQMGALIILIRKGTQQVVSLRLTQPGKELQTYNDIVSMNKQFNQLSISVPGEPQAILAQFEEKRHFSIAVCLLQKAGFCVSDALATSLLTNLQTHETTPGHGPLLSSITPLSSLPLDTSRGSETQHDLSFTEMLAVPSQPFRTPTVYDSRVMHTTQRHVPVPVQSYPATRNVLNTSPVAAQFNPYNMFHGGGNTYSYVPRVNSPLRHSFVPALPSAQSPINEIGFSSYPNTLAPEFDTSPIVQGNLGRGDLGHSQNNNLGAHNANKPVLDETTDKLLNYQLPQDKTQEYRNLMPQPRKLPFGPSAKDHKADGKSASQETERVRVDVKVWKTHDLKKTSTVDQSFAGVTVRGKRKSQSTDTSRKKVTSERDQLNARTVTTTSVLSDSGHKQAVNTSVPISEVVLPAKRPKQDTYEDAQCQTDIQLETSGVSGLLKITDPGKQSPGHDVSPLVVVTDPDTLKDLHEACATLFEEYEKEVGSCEDQALHAELYLDRIWKSRRDFWLRRLQDSEGLQ
ncbi:hypothetical protein FLONG3_4212 [Fusarium longipes]|uniref:Uncharacterized protein n=1 Tax=Fusarium longipes TaxID=694270 RepID=A0A395SZU1_9HYPO|nr:hypothetical protein FLONG3_4212 [Fusarium longipes]